MPRLSLYKPTKGNDDTFFDKRMHEMFTVGGVDVNIHLYLGPLAQPNISATEPGNTSPLSTGITGIQDLLFLENRDRKYDTSVYTMRTIYRINDNDFDLTQFGLFLTGDTMFATFHYQDMVQTLGRKLMVGDVLEMPNFIDYYPLDQGLPVALKRFFTVQDASRSAEGFAPTYWPHLWRVKLQPLVDSQEYKDIINQIAAGENTTDTLGQVLSTLDKYIGINDAIVQRAEQDVPASGYDTSSIYVAPVTDDGYPVDPNENDTSALTTPPSGSAIDDPQAIQNTPYKVGGYLTGDGVPANGTTVAAGISFPNSPTVNDYYLRLDYIPNRLFRFDGRRWVKIEDSVRTNLTPGSQNQTQLSGFINDYDKFYENSVGSDVIRVANVYTPPANAITSSFSYTSGNVITKLHYVSSYGVKVKINNLLITGALDNIVIANSTGNIGFTVSNTLYHIGDTIEYTVYSRVVSQRQSLSQALRPTADNQ